MDVLIILTAALAVIVLREILRDRWARHRVREILRDHRARRCEQWLTEQDARDNARPLSSAVTPLPAGEPDEEY